jgi:hypothetical protein
VTTIFIAKGRAIFLYRNETNSERVFSCTKQATFVKDGINDSSFDGRKGAVNPERIGTKAAAHYVVTIKAGDSQRIRLWFGRVSEAALTGTFRRAGELPSPVCLPILNQAAFARFDSMLRQRKEEADEFYAALAPSCLGEEHRLIQRQALAGMLWTKQFYHYVVEHWLDGDPISHLPQRNENQGATRVAPSS